MSAVASSPYSVITKEFLEQLTGCQVLTYTVEDGTLPGDGYMSLMYSVKVDLIPKAKEGAKKPVKETRHLFLKCFLQHPARQEFLRKTNVFYKELAFYRDWVKALTDFQIEVVGIPEDKLITPPFPPFVGGAGVDFSKLDRNDSQATKHYGPLDNFIAMTDLREEGFQLAKKSGGLDLNHLTLAVAELAKEHSLGWAFRNKVEWNAVKKFPFLNESMHDEERGVWSNVGKSRMDLAVKTLDAVLGEGNHLSKSAKAYRANVDQVMEFFLDQKDEAEKEAWKMHRSPPKDMVEMSNNEEPWRLQTHGDIWSNNMLFKYDPTGKPERVTLLDMQITRQGCPSMDLTYMIFTATDSKFRKTHLDFLLQLYCDKFTEYCQRLESPLLPGFSLEALKRRLHLAKISGFMLALMLFPMTLVPTAETNLEHAEEDTKLEDMFTDSFEKHAFESPVYRERLIDVAQELYDQGVI